MRRLALITGGTSGIGLATAKRLASDYDLALNYRGDHERAEKARAILKETNPEARVELIQAEVMNEGGASELYSRAAEVFDRTPSVLVCAAGRLRDGLLMQSDFADVRAIIDEHLVVPMALAKYAVKSMYKDRFGRIIFLSSISARYVKRGQCAYTTAKAGLEGFLKTLALEVAHRGCTVNAVAPGLIATPMTESFIEHFKDRQGEDFAERIPAGRVGSPEEVANAIGYLCSEAASYITGTVITIDGGRSVGEVRS